MQNADGAADYADATFYDLENDSFEPDGPFYEIWSEVVYGAN